MWVKFCGITRLEDALYAKKLGADAIGFIFAKSPRKVNPAIVKEICLNVNDITKVGVFVNDTLESIQQIKEYCSLDLVQLHGDEDSRFCEAFGESCTKALRIKSSKNLNQINKYKDTWKIVLDAVEPGKGGGTGKVIQMDILQQINNPDRIILAGGLNPDNISSILTTITPFGVDVSSGVEIAPGIKDHERMNEFITRIRGRNA